MLWAVQLTACSGVAEDSALNLSSALPDMATNEERPNEVETPQLQSEQMVASDSISNESAGGIAGSADAAGLIYGWGRGSTAHALTDNELVADPGPPRELKSGLEASSVTCEDLHPLRQIRRWALEVLQDTEFGDVAAAYPAWRQPPSISMIAGSAEEKQLLIAAVEDINSALDEDGPLVEILEDGQPEAADVSVYFVPLSEFPAVGEIGGFPIIPGSTGLWWTFWNRNFVRTEAYVLVANDVVGGASLEHLVLEELVGALGFSDDSARFEESIIYEDLRRGQFGDATRLSPCDRKLMRFVYDYLTPGETDIPGLFDSEWLDLAQP